MRRLYLCLYYRYACARDKWHTMEAEAVSEPVRARISRVDVLGRAVQPSKAGGAGVGGEAGREAKQAQEAQTSYGSCGTSQTSRHPKPLATNDYLPKQRKRL